mmetsp:Transcript_38388/g.90286  ORF Transcript_38388/g.90286 Transcript_38388/m.90286 type:complete len:564 (+) Transcript_38388:3-1694(+)
MQQMQRSQQQESAQQQMQQMQQIMMMQQQQQGKVLAAMPTPQFQQQQQPQLQQQQQQQWGMDNSQYGPPQHAQQQQQSKQNSGGPSQAQLALSPQQLLMLLQEHQRSLAERHGDSNKPRRNPSSTSNSNGPHGQSSNWRKSDGRDSDDGSPTPRCETPPNPSLRQHFATMTGCQSRTPPPPPAWSEASDGPWPGQEGFTGAVLHPVPQGPKSGWVDYVDGPLPYYLNPPQQGSPDMKGAGKGNLRNPSTGKGGLHGGKPMGDSLDKPFARQSRGKGKPDSSMLGQHQKMGFASNQYQQGQQQAQAQHFQRERGELHAGTGEAPPDGDFNQGNAQTRRRTRRQGRLSEDMDQYGEGKGHDDDMVHHNGPHSLIVRGGDYGGSAHANSVPPSDTMKAQLQALQEEDPAAVFIARRINKLGFTSAEQLRTYFSRYGWVKGVYVSHSRVKSSRPYIKGAPSGETHWRLRAAALGFVVMASTDATARILADGPDVVVNGVIVRVQQFNRRGDTGASDVKEDLEAYGQGDVDDLEVCPSMSEGKMGMVMQETGHRERWCTAEEDMENME